MGGEQLTEQYRSLDCDARIEALLDLQRQRAAIDAAEQRLLAVLATDPAADSVHRQAVIEKEFVRDEVACALRIGYGTARTRLYTARALVSRFPDALDALAAGAITLLHCRVLVECTRNLEPDVASLIGQHVLPEAERQTIGEFRRTVTGAVLALDPADSAERHSRAAADRRVEHYPGEDGMATLWALLPAADAQAVMTALNSLAGRLDASDERTMDQRRADALTDLALDALDRVCPTVHGRKPAVQVTVALSTLLGLDQQPGQLAGYGPICPELAREIAFDPTGTWRRLLTDQHGRLIDLGLPAAAIPG